MWYEMKLNEREELHFFCQEVWVFELPDLPPCLLNYKFQRLHHLLDPVPDANVKHYKPFTNVYSTNTTEEHMSSLKTVRCNNHQIPINPLQQNANNTKSISLNVFIDIKWVLRIMSCAYTARKKTLIKSVMIINEQQTTCFTHVVHQIIHPSPDWAKYISHAVFVMLDTSGKYLLFSKQSL